MKILSHENQCVYHASTTVYTQKQISCVTLNYEVVTSLILYTLWYGGTCQKDNLDCFAVDRIAIQDPRSRVK